MKKKTVDIHETLMQLATTWTDIENSLYEEGKRVEVLLHENEQLVKAVTELKKQVSKLQNQLSVSRSYTQTLKRQLDEASLRPSRST